MVTVLNLGGQKKSWIKDLIIIAIAAIGGYYLVQFITKGNGNGGAGAGGGLPQQKAVEQTLGLFRDYLQEVGSGMDLGGAGGELGKTVEGFWDFTTGMWKTNPFTFGTGIFYDWFTQWGNEIKWGFGGTTPLTDNGNGETNGFAPAAPAAPTTPTFKRTSPAPITQVLSLPAKMHEHIPNLVVPVIPESATPGFSQAIRALFPAQLL